MKKLILSTLLVCTFFLVQTSAQIQTPGASPSAKIMQTVGLTDITIDFSRPGKKGRELFVDVEKWGQMWRTGANASTKIEFSDDVKIEGKDVKKGKYAIYSIPGKETWTVMLYSDLSLGGNVNGYDASKEVLRFNVKTIMSTEEMESFNFMFDNLTDNSATIAFMWGKYYVPFKVEVEVDKKVMAAIEKTMAGVSRNDYYQAALYYSKSNKDLDQALTWAKAANDIAAKEGEPRYWQLRLEAQIYAQKGDYNRAKAKMNESSEAAKKAGNNGYAEANEKMAMDWK
jgi:DUF2911 family protein